MAAMIEWSLKRVKVNKRTKNKAREKKNIAESFSFLRKILPIVIARFLNSISNTKTILHHKKRKDQRIECSDDDHQIQHIVVMPFLI